MINLLYFNISAKGLFQEKTSTLVSTMHFSINYIVLLYFNISAKGLFQEKTSTLVSTTLVDYVVDTKVHNFF